MAHRKTAVLGTLLAILLGVVGVVGGAATLRVRQTLRPTRQAVVPFDFAAVRLQGEAVEFVASDGLHLAGWLLSGRTEWPPIVLCHDFGESKASLINLGIALNKRGFPVLAFDFRDHGASQGDHSTLGLEEKRDVLGAIDFLAGRKEFHRSRVGVYGVGMGAHAAVLAAADRGAVKVLVLDGLYPDVAYPLIRRVYAGWDIGVRRLGFLPEGIFALLNRTQVREERAAEVLARLAGRDLLLLAPAGDSTLAREIERMYQAIPDQKDVDGNFVLLPATHSQGLYGENLRRHHARVEEFFLARLPRTQATS